MRAQLVFLAALAVVGAACTDRAVDAADGSPVIRRDGWPHPTPDLWPWRPDRALPPPPDVSLPPPIPDMALPPPTNHFILVLASEQAHLPSKGAPTPTPGKLALLVVDAYYPSPAHKPDFIDKPKPPHCVGYRWKQGGAPTRVVSRAGTFYVSGHAKTTVAGQTLPSVINCLQGQVGPSSIYGYSCKPLDLVTPLTGPAWLDATTKLSVKTSGGVEVPPFFDSSAAPPATAPTLWPAVDLNRIDPAGGVKISWNPGHSSMLTLIIFRASLQDQSEHAELWCSQLTVIGSKTIPGAALALFPKPKSASNRLMIFTQVIGAAVTGKNEVWGSHMLAVGRGVFGVSCRTPTGSCW